MALTDKLIEFAEVWLATGNQAEAYARTHPKAKRNTCWSGGERIMRNHEVRAYIAERLKDMILTADETMARVSSQARGSIEPFLKIQKDGFAAIDFSTQQAKQNLHLVKKVKAIRTRRMVGRGDKAEPWEDERVEIELIDTQKALDMLAKYHNLYTEKDDDGHPLTDEQRMEQLIALYESVRARLAGQTPGDSSAAVPARPTKTGKPA